MNLLESYNKVCSADVSLVAKETPLQLAPILSKKLNHQIWMKREDMQPVFSFKCRGAHNKIRQLADDQKRAGIIAASAGNHAQGVALSAQKLNIACTIVMPTTTPKIKVDAVSALGATTVLFGDSYDDAYEHALGLSKTSHQLFIHPYDDPDVIAGQGTIALEIIQQLKTPIDAIFVAVGGGGLLAGVLSVFKVVSPSTKVIGVEPENSNCLAVALKENKRVKLKSVGIFTDGVAVKQIGETTFPLIKDHIDGVICVSIDEICAAIKDIYNETRGIVEPAGALSMAGLKQYIKQHPNESNLNLVAINCGANMNFDRLRHIAERTEIGENKELLLCVELDEAPGSLFKFCTHLNNRTITEFNYRFQSNRLGRVFLGIETSGPDDNIKQLLADTGHSLIDLTNDECAKIHVRHMIGGTPGKKIENECTYRFQFPERPGALLEFLKALQNKWSITMFHYRNHGAAYGRVLVGFDVPYSDVSSFNQLIEQLPIQTFNETNNPAIRYFLN